MYVPKRILGQKMLQFSLPRLNDIIHSHGEMMISFEISISSTPSDQSRNLSSSFDCRARLGEAWTG